MNTTYRLEFAYKMSKILQSNEIDRGLIWFSDEANFWRDGYPYFEAFNKEHVKGHCFMHDGARSYRTDEVFEIISAYFHKRVIEQDYCKYYDDGIDWQPYSPDWNQWDYLLWVYIKDKPLCNQSGSLTDLKSAIEVKFRRYL
ncbi:hypothetical protein RF11_06589 [Thelohanellus kitauei]|uniref:Uncharacterized protein n=1 Tax=Thelohanellus kitauei TaxID=669202 RepID=A0A0C2MFQ8_THEKT|nr:hypothetical protein RF11_06589 [Thelohanellus kitauei]